MEACEFAAQGLANSVRHPEERAGAELNHYGCHVFREIARLAG